MQDIFTVCVCVCPCHSISNTPLTRIPPPVAKATLSSSSSRPAFSAVKPTVSAGRVYKLWQDCKSRFCTRCLARRDSAAVPPLPPAASRPPMLPDNSRPAFSAMVCIVHNMSPRPPAPSNLFFQIPKQHPAFSATAFRSSALPSPVAPSPVQVITPVPAPVEPEPQPEVGDAAYTGQGTVAVVLYKYEVSHMAFFSKYFLKPSSVKI